MEYSMWSSYVEILGGHGNAEKDMKYLWTIY